MTNNKQAPQAVRIIITGERSDGTRFEQFSPHSPLILQAVLLSGEVHSIPLKVFQPHPSAPVGMVMRCRSK